MKRSERFGEWFYALWGSIAFPMIVLPCIWGMLAVVVNAIFPFGETVALCVAAPLALPVLAIVFLVVAGITEMSLELFE